MLFNPHPEYIRIWRTLAEFVFHFSSYIRARMRVCAEIAELGIRYIIPYFGCLINLVEFYEQADNEKPGI